MDLFSDLPQALTLEHEIPAKETIKRKADDEGGTESKRISVSVETATRHIVFCGVAAARRGERDEMQDAHRIIDDMSPLLKTSSRTSFYGVFDGHAGARAALFSAEKIPDILAKKYPESFTNKDKDIKRCLVETFLSTDREFLQKCTEANPTWKDGCTAVVCFVVDDTIFAANLGDSKCVVGRFQTVDGVKTITAKRLTKDHSPTIYEERMRIQKAGGSVIDGRVNGMLEVSRSIGDGRFKHCGVTANPDVFRFQITGEDAFILLACDGLWKVFDVDSAIKWVAHALEEAKLSRKFPDCYAQAQSVVNGLVNEAVKRGSSDNVTALLVSIIGPSGPD